MSTLKAYFEGKRELFEGLAIGRLELDAGEVESFMTRLRAFFGNIPYELSDNTERHYQTIFLSRAHVAGAIYGGRSAK